MATPTNDATRRRFLTVTGAGLAVALGTAGAAAAAEPTAAEKAT
jgi:hypothetical protein